MTWKKGYKKNVDNDLFAFKGTQTTIVWPRVYSNKKNIYTEGRFVIEVKELFKKTDSIIKNNKYPIKLKEYSFNFANYKYFENFKSIGFSNFKETYENFSKKIGSYKSAILVYALAKFSNLIIEKFFAIYKENFSSEDINDYNIVNLFETMKYTSIEQMQAIIDLFLAKVENINLSQDSENSEVEELIDLGDNFTLHWSRMFREVLYMTNESINIDYSFKKSDENNDENFDEFFEKTKTIIISSEYDEALKYFNLTKQTTYNEFKKIYRSLAKRLHPDMNNDKIDMEMKKANYYKSIIDRYMNV